MIDRLGENLTYYYDGFEIHFQAIHQPEYRLHQVVFYEGSVMVFDSKNTMKTETSFASNVKDYENARVQLSTQDEILIELPQYSELRIIINQEDGIIKKIRWTIRSVD